MLVSSASPTNSDIASGGEIKNKPRNWEQRYLGAYGMTRYVIRDGRRYIKEGSLLLVKGKILEFVK